MIRAPLIRMVIVVYMRPAGFIPAAEMRRILKYFCRSFIKKDGLVTRTGKDAVFLYISAEKGKTLIIDLEVLKGKEGRSVIAHHAVFRSQPYKSVFILYNIFYAVLGQSIIRIVMGKTVFLAAKGQTDEQENKKQQPVGQNKILLQ